jgi:hypothetical protein
VIVLDGGVPRRAIVWKVFDNVVACSVALPNGDEAATPTWLLGWEHSDAALDALKVSAAVWQAEQAARR